MVRKIRGGRKKIFSNVLRSLEKLCILSQNQLSSDKLFLFTLQLAVVHTAPYVHNGAVHRDLF